MRACSQGCCVPPRGRSDGGISLGTWQGWKVLGDLKFSCHQFRFQRVCAVPRVHLKKQPLTLPAPLPERAARRPGRERASELSAAEGSQARPLSANTKHIFQLEAFQLLGFQHVFNLTFAFVLVFCLGCFSTAHGAGCKRLRLYSFRMYQLHIVRGM